MAEAILEVVLENLSSLVEKELGLFFGVNKEIKRLESTLSTIRAVLEDAEEKQLTNPAIKNWLQKLKDAAFVLDDILDECSTQARRFQQGGLNKVHMSCLPYIHPKYVAFRAKIAKQMKEISETLDEIAKEKNNFHLHEAVVGRKTDVMEWRQTTSVIAEVEVYGRENDRNRIIETLIGQGSDSESVFVYPIVGIGGLGKTTLAQLVFNDERITEHFDLKIWVCVSEDFNLKRILKDAIESAQGNSCGDINLEALQKHLREIIRRKRYLLVLDDVWNEDQEKWNRLKYFLACESKGASILVTTRLANVAYVMGSVPPHQLPLLSDDDCWLLFKQRAFGPEKEGTNELLAIGRDIVKKCAGVPLAAKALGSLLRFKIEEAEWLHVKESSLWNLPQDETSILPALRLSYVNLPLQLRQCFAFCAIFPKDFVMEKNLLIHLWMANGFISSNGTMTDEDIGNEICNELYLRSFFQDIEKHKFGKIFRFKMHDLVHDLAQSIMDDASCIIVDESAPDLPRRIHHVSCYGNWRTTQNEARVYRLLTNYLGSLHSGKLGSLRTYLGLLSGCGPCDHLPTLLKFSSLRALTMRDVQRKKLPSSIGHLIHLRYLDISFGKFEALPQSICSLLNLQVLKLDYCYSLQKLPNRLKCLKALCHLSMSNCTSLSSIPPKLGQLTLLRRLSIYIAGEKRGRMLAELECLKLKGELRIKHLERVRSAEDAKKANMASKHLNTLLLSWDRNYNLESHENAEKILEALEPHRNLRDLGVGGYKGVHWPYWMGNPTFKALSEIELVDCANCLRLPPLGKLPTLKYLTIHNMNHLRYIDDESYNGGAVTSFTALECLTLTMLPNLERLSKEEAENMFPCLSVLEVAECPKLALPSHTSITSLITAKRCELRNSTGYGPKTEGCNQDQAFLSSVHKLRDLQFLHLIRYEESTSFPNGMLQGLACLKELHICHCTKLEVLPTEVTELNNLHALEKLRILGCDSLESFTEQTLQGLHSLQTLTLARCNKFECLSEGVQHLTSLKYLAITRCPKVEGLPAALQQITSLHSLRLHELPKLALLPHWLGNLTLLQTLDISRCPLLRSLPASIQHIRNLKHLNIGDCPELQKRCEKDTEGEDWHKIAHVPRISRNPYPTYSLDLSCTTFFINYRDI